MSAGASWAALLAVWPLLAQPAPEHGRRYNRLLIRDAMVLEGNATPAAGPKHLLIEQGRIARILTAGGAPPEADAVIDAAGKYVLPGFVNLHGHIHHERAGLSLPVEYVLKLWLSCGITTVRDVGSDFENSKKLREASRQGRIAAPRIFLYPFFGRPIDEEAARARVRELKEAGADGIKLVGIHRDTMDAMSDEARRLGLRVAHHAGVEETNAWDSIRNRVASIEHWYGIPDAALADGVQNFPPDYNYQDELDRFRWAGRLWREADPARLEKVLRAMAEAGVAWDPTLNIYEASRDLQRAQTQPQFRDYLHPALAKFFEPNRNHHGSFFFHWTTADEIYWKENYRLWMQALVQFARLGGVITTGEDAGFIYQIYGFGYLRELELHQEAGFHPLKVIQHATLNGARVLGEQHRLGRLRAGWAADLIVVNGNPLENLKILNPMGVEIYRGESKTRGGGIEWTVKDGYVFHAPRLFAEVKELVRQARARAQEVPSL